MHYLLPKLRAFIMVMALANVALLAQNIQARAFDMDCKVILCIAGGFPASCGDA